tara:strand:+ start:584 stop:955 length:372 start_codon:yes stop_codon:yes gene_type:complete
MKNQTIQEQARNTVNRVAQTAEALVNGQYPDLKVSEKAAKSLGLALTHLSVVDEELSGNLEGRSLTALAKRTARSTDLKARLLELATPAKKPSKAAAKKAQKKGAQKKADAKAEVTTTDDANA